MKRLGLRSSWALVLAILLLCALALPALAESDVEWNGLGHLGQSPAPTWQLCNDATRFYRQPGSPRADQAVDIRATAYPFDLTSLNVWYTTNAAADEQGDWTPVAAAYESPDVLCSRGTVAPWKATLPPTGKQVWYKIQYVDGSSVAWQRQPGEGAAPISNMDGGWTTGSTSLTYQAPTNVFVDDDFTSATPGWGYDHFADLTDGIAAAATGATVNVADGVYNEVQVSVTRSMTIQGAGAATTVIDGGSATGLPTAGLVSITAPGDVLFDGFALRNAGASGASLVRVGVYAASPVAGVTYTVSHNTITGSNDPLQDEDYGLYTNGGLESLVFTYNTISGMGGNSILIERHPGATDVSYNTFDRGIGDDAVDAYFNMNYGGADVTTLQKVSHNAIDLGGGTVFTSDARSVGVSFAGNYTQAAGAGGYTNVEITDNTITNLKPYRRGISLWNNALGDGATGDIQNAVIAGNTITGPGGAGSFGIRLLGRATNAALHDNTVSGPEYVFRGMTYNGHIASGAAVNHNNFSNSSLGFEWQGTTILNAEENWWGAGCGGVGGIAITGNVDYTPWWIQAGGPALGSADPAGNYIIPTGATTADGQAIIACAPENATVIFQGGPYPGGYVINTNGLHVKLNGSTIGHGSPAFTVNADDVVIQGVGTLDGQGAGDPAVLVNAGADNFTLRDVTVTRWQDGVELAGSVVSFKMFGNFIHANTGDGLHIDAGAAIDGVINIDGNLFKNNTGAGVNNAGANTALNVQYNSWGDLLGPTGPQGDGTAGSVDASNFTFIEPFMDLVPDTLAANVGVIEGQSFTAALKVDAAKLYGFTFKFTYDPAYLTLDATTFVGPWTGRCSSLSATPGVVAYRCQLLDPAPAVDVTAGAVATFAFTVAGGANDGPWTTYLDLSHLVADTSAAAVGGAKIFVNNAGYGAPSATGRGITDTDDGSVTITGIAQYKGFVDLQGRTSEAGATVKVFNQAVIAGATQHAQAVSAASGAYTTAYVPPQVMTVGTSYWLVVDRRLYLATTPSAATSYSHNKLLTTRPTTPLATVLLLGGDATDDEIVNVLDATCIGGSYAAAPVVCGITGTSDVNEDGVVDILDLSLMGGNYEKTSSAWAP